MNTVIKGGDESGPHQGAVGLQGGGQEDEHR